jgi:translation initiation factor IF-3
VLSQDTFFLWRKKPIKNYNNRTKPVKEVDPVNENITSKEVLVIDDLGEKLGVMATSAAIRLAMEKELDLVVVSPNGNPPVAKFMDYSRYRFEQQRKAKEMKKKTQQFELKELRFSHRHT